MKNLLILLLVGGLFAFTLPIEERSSADTAAKVKITNPGFEDEGGDKYRGGWRNSKLGGIVQITSKPVHEGEKAAKLPASGDRIAYQAIKVKPGKDYTLTFYYTMKKEPKGILTASILNGHVTDSAKIKESTIASVDLNDQSAQNDYERVDLDFNAGESSKIAILLTNKGAECRFDSFSIKEK